MRRKIFLQLFLYFLRLCLIPRKFAEKYKRKKTKKEVEGKIERKENKKYI